MGVVLNGGSGIRQCESGIRQCERDFCPAHASCAAWVGSLQHSWPGLGTGAAVLGSSVEISARLALCAADRPGRAKGWLRVLGVGQEPPCWELLPGEGEPQRCARGDCGFCAGLCTFPILLPWGGAGGQGRLCPKLSQSHPQICPHICSPPRRPGAVFESLSALEALPMCVKCFVGQYLQDRVAAVELPLRSLLHYRFPSDVPQANI